MYLLPSKPDSSTKLKVFSFLLLSAFLLTASGCSLFGDSVSGDSQSGGTSIQDRIRNLVGTYDVTYDLNETLSTCQEVIPIFTVQAEATAEEQNERILLNWQFSDAPALIVGFYDPDTDDYEGETPPVLIQGTQYAQEAWEISLQFSADQTAFVGGSLVDFGMRTKDESDVDPDCSRYFNINGLRLDN